MKLVRTILIGGGASLLGCAAALAQAAPAAAVNAQDVYTAVLQPVLMAVGVAAATVVTALAAYGVQWLRKKTGIQGLELDAQHRDALQAAITNAAGLALNQLGNSLQGRTIDVGSPAVQAAVQYVVKTAPEALEHFDLSGKSQEIAEKIVAKLPQVANTTTQT
jgi:chemotaxis protein CheY-P-specific phosphatase CheC